MKIRFKLTLSILGLMSLMFGIGGSLLIDTSFRASLQSEKSAALGAHQMVISTLQIANGANMQTGYGDISDTLRRLTEQNVNLWDGLRLGNDEITIFEYGNFAFPDIQSPATIGTCIVKYMRLEDGSHVIAALESLLIEDETMHLLLLRDVSPLVESRDMQLNTYRYIFAATAILSLALSYVLSVFFTGSLSKLSAAAHDIAKGRLSARAVLRSSDEIGALARDFNSMAEALEASFNELQESVKRQERFTGSFAHEMKTPMTSIIGYADLIRSEKLNSDEQLEAANYIVSEGKRLESLSWKLLELLAIKDGKINRIPVRPRDIIAELADRMKASYASQGIELKYTCDNGVFSLDADLIKSMLINFMDNARKAITGEGCIYLSSAVDGHTLTITVSDNGQGIPPHALSHLTEAFYRVDKARSRMAGGVGLGLALCAEIAAAHNGTIRFESALGSGTRVTVSLTEENQ